MDTATMSQATIFLFSVILGIFLSLLYDCFRIADAVLKVNIKRIFAEDIIYFILSAIVTFIYILVVNMGEIRIYIICEEVIGWLIYRLTVRKFIYRTALKIVKFFYNWFCKLKRYIISKITQSRIKNKIKKIFSSKKATN